MKSILVVAAVIYQNEKVLIVRRGPKQSGAGSWEFPGGKVEHNETETQALGREILEELNVHIHVGKKIGDHVQQYSSKVIHLHVYWAKIISGTIVLKEHDDQCWVDPSHIDIEKLSDADQPFVEKIKNWKGVRGE